MPAPPRPERLARRRAIGERIRIARKGAGLSQLGVAEQVGISVDNYGRIERGQSSPTLDTLLGIADAIGAPLSELVREGSPGRRTGQRGSGYVRPVSTGVHNWVWTHTVALAPDPLSTSTWTPVSGWTG